MPVTENEIYGPITIDRDMIIKKKCNFYNLTRKENFSFYYNKDKFNPSQKKKLSKKKKIIYVNLIIILDLKSKTVISFHVLYITV